MARVPRSWVIQEGATFHKVWRGHNKEWNLGEASEKLKYLNLLYEEKAKDTSPLRALCLMSNHTHEVYTLKNLPSFSNFMRRHHSRYGMYFNFKHKRCGKVAQDRPLTSQFENEEHEMRAIFYIHANPLRAGICKDAKDYAWSTHKLYAFGVKPKWLKDNVVEFPQWYLDLGKTMEQRQKAYRQMFDRYLLEQGLRKQPLYIYGTGSPAWVLKRHKEISHRFRDYVNSA